MAITLEQLRKAKIISKNRYVIKKGKAGIEKKARTKSGLPRGVYGRIILLTEKEIINEK